MLFLGSETCSAAMLGQCPPSARRLDSLSRDTCVLLVSNRQPRHRSGHGCRPGPTRVMNPPRQDGEPSERHLLHCVCASAVIAVVCLMEV